MLGYPWDKKVDINGLRFIVSNAVFDLGEKERERER